MTAVLALDVGSSSVRAQRFDERGEAVDELRQERYGGDDPDEIVRLARSAIAGREQGADAVGVSCFGHSLLALDERGRPLTPILGWRDVRSAPAADRLRELLDILDHAAGPEEFLEHTKLEMFQDQVFCFTPKGDLIALPRGATPVINSVERARG